MSARRFQVFLVHLLPVLVLGLAASRAMAAGDPPGRVARLNYADGPVVFAPAGDNEWTDAVFNRPLTRGDRIWTDKGSRAELQVASAAVRMDGQTHVEILALDDRSAQLSVTQGSVFVRVRSLPEGENFEIDTPNLAYRAAYPGDYRIDVDASLGTTRVTIHSGTGAVYGEGGQVLPLGGGQQITFRARTLATLGTQESPPQDNFDRWAGERNRREDQSVSARHVPREVVGYQQLDAHGIWTKDAAYGHVWYPQGMAANWAPYRNGHWEWIGPWGWTWIDDAAWGFAPFHYGRWALIDSRWAWVPGRMSLKPVYAPALVAFVGGAGGGVNWNIVMGSGRPGVAWFPLAPGEPWQPGYAASTAYLASVNYNVPPKADAVYAHQRKPEALTSIAAEDFHRGKPVRANWLRVAANTLANAQVVPPPPMPERSGVIAQARVASAAASATARTPAPPPAAVAQAPAPVAAPAAAPVPAAKAPTTATPAPPVQAKAPAPAPAQPVADAQIARQAAEQKQRAQLEQARREQQARASEQARHAEQQAKAEKLARRAEQARREQVAARRAEQARRELQARQAEQQKREQLAQREQARREQAAKLAEKRKREEQARRAEQARREAVARREEQQRREVHAKHVEQAQRAAERDAQALREQRAQREEQLAKREAQEREQAQQREQAQRAAWARQQQALSEQWRRDQEAWEQQQRRDRARQRPDLRDDRRSRSPDTQRGVPILGAGPLS